MGSLEMNQAPFVYKMTLTILYTRSLNGFALYKIANKKIKLKNCISMFLHMMSNRKILVMYCEMAIKNEAKNIKWEFYSCCIEYSLR